MLIALRKAYRDLTRRRLRSMLTIIGIVIGVAGIVAITSTSKNMVAAQTAALSTSAADPDRSRQAGPIQRFGRLNVKLVEAQDQRSQADLSGVIRTSGFTRRL